MTSSEPTETLGSHEPLSAASHEISHGRYLLGDVIGSGGFGQVHRALDRLTGETVAIKFVPALSASDLSRARRELAALRWLRTPGVIRLRDDGLDGTSWFIVMDLVDGQPFDTVARAGPWEHWSRHVLELLEILARVHLAGVLHLDLKPSNVLITPQERVVILDFGIARGRAVPKMSEEHVEGTPRYMAPEQLHGGVCDARTDLYALGEMLFRMAPDLPAPVRSIIDAMRAPSPGDRPASALAVYTALAGRSPFPSQLVRARAWDRDALRSLFTGPQTFTHIADDAAALLWERTQGEPSQVRSLIEDWLLGGHMSWSGESLLVDRPSLERVGGKLSIDLLGTDTARLLSDVHHSVCALRQQGRLDAAIALLDAVSSLVQTEGLDMGEPLLVERVLAAVAMERPAAADLALHLLDCAPPTSAVRQLALLVRLARSVLRGEAMSAAAHAAMIDPFEHPDLEIRRQAYRVRAASLRSIEEEALVLDEIAAWAEGDPKREAKRAGWSGNHLYRRGLYREAALAHERAAADKTAVDRLGSMVNAASAWLEALEFPRAARWAEDAARLAYELRHPTFEALAIWLIRTIAYRSGQPADPNVEMLDAAAALAPYLGALFALTDAAAALRLGDRALCAALADRASAAFTTANMGTLCLLTRALAAFAQREHDDGTLVTLVEQARGGPIPDIELQILAFARWRADDPSAEWTTRLDSLAALRPREHWGTRLDVLSIDEALADRPPGGS